MKADRQPATAGYTLAEVSIAMGIFAFVVVAIFGMFPTAVRMRSESALETRAVMIANELFATVRNATNLSAVTLRDGPKFSSANLQTVDLSRSNAVVFGYPAQTSVPFYLWASSTRGGTPESAWVNGAMPTGALKNEVVALAKVQAQQVASKPGLYLVTVDVRSPAGVPLSKTKVLSFYSYQYAK